jgi:hypothetical protein
MKPSLTNANDLAAVLARLDRLRPDSERQWGTLTTTQMLTHVGEQIRICLGDKPVPPKNSALMRRLAKWYALRMTALPKNMRTLRELNPSGGLMTPPTDFEQDRRTLHGLIERLVRLPPDSQLAHPVFGSLTKNELGQLTYLHLDHHLRQFGV